MQNCGNQVAKKGNSAILPECLCFTSSNLKMYRMKTRKISVSILYTVKNLVYFLYLSDLSVMGTRTINLEN